MRHGRATGADHTRGMADPVRGVVELVCWPGEGARRDELRRAGRARLLLVAPDAAPPTVREPIEDWIRVPADAREVDVRLLRLARIVRDRIGVADRSTGDRTLVAPRRGSRGG